MMRTSVTLIVLAGLAALPATAEVQTEQVTYQHEDVTLHGYLAHDTALEGPRPGVVVVHEWWGLNDFAKDRARALAELGYVALAIDMYGEGQTTTEREQAQALAGRFYEDTDLARSRAAAGLAALGADKRVDADRIAAIGYCFGGSIVLQMAYAGLPLQGVVAFHGGLYPPREGDDIGAKVLILHGADDPLVPDQNIANTQEGLREAGADWQMIYYGGAVHSFTNPKAGGAGIEGVAYHEATERRSWTQMRAFFDELFD